MSYCFLLFHNRFIAAHMLFHTCNISDCKRALTCFQLDQVSCKQWTLILGQIQKKHDLICSEKGSRRQKGWILAALRWEQLTLMPNNTSILLFCQQLQMLLMFERNRAHGSLWQRPFLSVSLLSAYINLCVHQWSRDRSQVMPNSISHSAAIMFYIGLLCGQSRGDCYWW